MRFTCRLQCLHHPHVMKATKPCLPLTAYSSQSGSGGAKGQRRCHLHIRNRNQADWTLHNRTNRVVDVVFVCLFCIFFKKTSSSLQLTPTSALKGLTSLCGSRSLSCTDLINNFYQPLAQEISRGWVVGLQGGEVG